MRLRGILGAIKERKDFVITICNGDSINRFNHAFNTSVAN